MVNSMTGYASLGGQGAGYRWTWDMRGVNAKGQDLRMRVPDWISGLEPAVRAALGKAVGRGNVSLTLRVTRETDCDDARLDPEALNTALSAIEQIESAASARGVTLAPVRASDILMLRGVQDSTGGAEDTAPLLAALLADLPTLIASFNAMRASEGAALAGVLAGQLQQIETHAAQAGAEAEARKDRWAEALRDNLARVLDNADGADPDRVAQELALITVKADVTEELDRLGAHIAAASDLLAQDGPIGRKLDFLMQEFNREANTLCSKAQSTGLTRIGLDLKAIIDQMREQVQNVE